jgi:hypothetical protein
MLTPSSSCRPVSRSSTWAWMETSSAGTGSSQTMTSIRALRSIGAQHAVRHALHVMDLGEPGDGLVMDRLHTPAGRR